MASYNRVSFCTLQTSPVPFCSVPFRLLGVAGVELRHVLLATAGADGVVRGRQRSAPLPRDGGANGRTLRGLDKVHVTQHASTVVLGNRARHKP